MARAATNSKDSQNPKTKKAPSAFVTYYLLAFNILSTIGWGYLLVLTIIHLFNLDGQSKISATSSAARTASVKFAQVLSKIPVLKDTSLAAGTFSSAAIEAQLPAALKPVFQRTATTWARVGPQTRYVQTLAVMEVVHALLGWVRSPIITTAMQVSSRLFIVWGVVEPFPAVRSNPLFTSMILAWSFTEVIRYSFYAYALLGQQPALLLWLRYTTFYILYPIGAGSEAFVNFASLPSSSPIPGEGSWGLYDYFRLAMFFVWWPSLYVLYTYMIGQRRKVLGKGSKKSKAE